MYPINPFFLDMRHITFTLLAVCILLSACKEDKANFSNDILFDTIHVVKAHNVNNDSTQPSFNFSMDFVYPIKMADTTVLSSIQKKFNEIYLEDKAYRNDSAQVAINRYLDQSIKSFEEEVKTYMTNVHSEEEDAAPYLSYYDKFLGHVLFNKNNILSFQVERNINKGKISFSSLRNYVFNLKTGELIHEEDIFLPTFASEMSPLILDKILKMNNATSVKDLTNAGFLQEVEEIIPNNNFYVTDEGITYIFNKGEYTALVLDAVQVSFKFEEIKFLLKENSPISSLIK